MTNQELIATCTQANDAQQTKIRETVKQQAEMITGWTEPVPVEWLRGVAETFMRLAIDQAKVDMARSYIETLKTATAEPTVEEKAIEKVRQMTLVCTPGPTQEQLAYAAKYVYDNDAALRNAYASAEGFTKKCECEITQWLPMEDK